MLSKFRRSPHIGGKFEHGQWTSVSPSASVSPTGSHSHYFMCYFVSRRRSAVDLTRGSNRLKIIHTIPAAPTTHITQHVSRRAGRPLHARRMEFFRFDRMAFGGGAERYAHAGGQFYLLRVWREFIHV